ncbi:hypothetical protein EMIHUDRAFT_117742 [Emiliania huxleyi CCMP1516]|uniref:ABC transporter domain-containing protein n=2 Tax=Emiliania huxleyi TaxID=2903 RepID=A0A0D3J9G2_EMIH1|nr:hypothetical protein EMIHUDRAFT_117742 [Emiliania huxleyi CCMP1516]EOD20147.1 hypothetical protein EMIHUDRAFT_117742 [Emiliania huxleyi CCMP1516]|eukprot:XP_005772576.1 hypothetical protein EMIHUDRAFT_117742 [Emiliania huxleyi CCMP1516]
MGGGNAQKSAMARQKNAEKAAKEGQGGGGAAGMKARSADSSVHAAAIAERSALQAQREERERLKKEKEAAAERKAKKLAASDGKGALGGDDAAAAKKKKAAAAAAALAAAGGAPAPKKKKEPKAAAAAAADEAAPAPAGEVEEVAEPEVDADGKPVDIPERPPLSEEELAAVRASIEERERISAAYEAGEAATRAAAAEAEAARAVVASKGAGWKVLRERAIRAGAAAMAAAAAAGKAEATLAALESVQTAAEEALPVLCSCVQNAEVASTLRDFIIDALKKPDKTFECVEEVLMTTFCNPMDGTSLAFMMPIIIRGIKDANYELVKKSTVCASNLCALIKDSSDIAPFVPLLLPLLEKNVEHSSPNIREATQTARERLLEVGACVRDSLAAAVPSLPEPVATYLSHTCAALLEERLGGVVRVQNFRHAVPATEQWVSSIVEPYATAEGGALAQVATAAVENFKSQLPEEARAILAKSGDKDFALDMQNIILAFAGRVLLRKADVRFERGHRYGLIGQNGTGKTTLLNRLAAKDINGFPQELRTWYVCTDVTHYDNGGQLGKPCRFVYYPMTFSEFQKLKPEIAAGLPRIDSGPPKSASQPASECSFKYPETDRYILKEVDATVTLGSRAVIVGGNGSGLSTLLVVGTCPGHARFRQGLDAEVAKLKSIALTDDEKAEMEKGSAISAIVGRTTCNKPWYEFQQRGKMKAETQSLPFAEIQLRFPPYVQKLIKNYDQKAQAIESGMAIRPITEAEPHVIALDEPTNYLDNDSVAALTKALKDFKGAVVTVSENEAFVNEISNEKWVVEEAAVTLVQLRDAKAR